MRKIDKSPDPESLTKFKVRNKENDWNLIHNAQNKSVYDECLLQCEVDQNNLCGYTEVKLESGVHIDHFVKRSIDPLLTFDWQNMIAAVHDSRFGADFKDSIVNDDYYDKQRHEYKTLLNPVTDALKNRFRYSTNGEIEPVSNNDADAEFPSAIEYEVSANK